MPNQEDLNLTTEEEAAIQESLDNIKNILKSKNISVKNMIGLVPTAEIDSTASQVEIRFAEEKMNVVMNMIAFD